jgi:hypothetical protein
MHYTQPQDRKFYQPSLIATTLFLQLKNIRHLLRATLAFQKMTWRETG